MLDTALNLTARLKQSLAPFETPLVSWFDELIEPIYDAGERVVQDHTSRYLELIVQLHTHHDVAQVIAWLEAQRAQQLSLRLAVRMLETQEEVTPCPLGQAVAEFRRGMVGLMQSYIAMAEHDSAHLQAYPYLGPTLLRQLYKTENESLADHRGQYIEIAKQQFKAFEKTWEDTVEAFTKIKAYCRELDQQFSLMFL
jgi:tRNA isopentenyl-2-thiomethyl-A-37 hydroxylase MiaE